jgi:hypothetical protein
MVNFLEHPAVTFHGLVLIAISTGSPAASLCVV